MKPLVLEQPRVLQERAQVWQAPLLLLEVLPLLERLGSGTSGQLLPVALPVPLPLPRFALGLGDRLWFSGYFRSGLPVLGLPREQGLPQRAQELLGLARQEGLRPLR